MRLWKALLLIGVAACFTVGTILLFTAHTQPAPAGGQTIPYLFLVGDVPGVDTGRDMFRLGQVPPDGGSWRLLTLNASVPGLPHGNGASPTTDKPRYYRVSARGAGASWLSIDPSTVAVPGDVNISVHPPTDAQSGRYEGTIVVTPIPTN